VTATQPAPVPPGREQVGEGIVTPEAVLLEFAVAGLGSRSLAFLIDLGIRAALLWLVFLGTAAGGIVVDDTVLVVISIAAVFAALLVYPALTETVWNGRTPGKMAMGLRVVTIEGAPVRFRHAAIRSALGIVDFLLGAGTLAILSALATRQSQRLGDLAAGTIVIRERQVRTDSRPVAFSPPPGWEAYTSALDVSRLRGDAYVLVRAFLLRVHELEPAARRERAASLAERVAAAIDVPLHPGTDPEAFLVAVAAAHQARHGDREAVPTASFVPPPAGKVVPPPVVDVDQPADTWGR
jgi:uncharacterized RDD family membrane protein YckC